MSFMINVSVYHIHVINKLVNTNIVQYLDVHD